MGADPVPRETHTLFVIADDELGDWNDEGKVKAIVRTHGPAVSYTREFQTVEDAREWRDARRNNDRF